MRRVWNRLPHEAQAIIAGVVAFSGTVVATWLLWNHAGIKSKAAKNNGIFSTELGFYQAISGLVATFLAGGLGWFAIKEFQEHHEKPVLYLALTNSAAPDGASETLRQPQEEHFFRISLSMRNGGSVIARWYTVEICLPFLYEWWKATDRTFNNDTIKDFIDQAAVYRRGDPDLNWQTSIAPYGTVSPASDSLKMTFFSDGSFAAFPTHPTTICDMRMPHRLIDVRKSYQLRYKIYTEDSPPTDRFLTVILEPTADGSTVQ